MKQTKAKELKCICGEIDYFPSKGQVTFICPACKHTEEVQRSIKLHPERFVEHQPQWLYACICGDFVKIGRAKYIDQRLRELQCGNPYPMRIFALEWITHHSKETEYHIKYAKYRHRGEWFRLEGELLEWIRKKESTADAVLSNSQ